jgi:hypothetical protein
VDERTTDRPRPWEALFPLGVLVLRLALGSRQAIYRDWMALLSVYWILYVFVPRRAVTAVTAAAMVALFAIYLSRAFPQVMDTLLLCR